MSSLATPPDIHAVLGRPLGDEETATFDTLNAAKSEIVEGYCGRRFLAATSTSRVVFASAGILRLPDPPVVSISAITADRWVDESLSVENLLVDPDGTVRSHGHQAWPDGRYEVTYSHGAATAPPDVRMVVAELIASAMLHQPAALSDDQKATLFRYRRQIASIEMASPWR